MKEYLIRVHRIYDIYVEAEDQESAEARAEEETAMLCADDILFEVLGCEVIEE